MSDSKLEELKAHRREVQRKWRKANPERIRYYSKQEWSKKVRQRWTEKNHDQYKTILNQWYENNKEKLKEKKSCDICGRMYQPINVFHHKKTKAHIQALAMKEIEERDVKG